MSEQKRALVVDDSKSARLVLRRMLEKHNLIVDTVESGKMALDFLNYNHPDIIFMDHMMPGLDGFETITAIKRNSDTAAIPVMMYTSKGGDLYQEQARDIGAIGVLPKTVAPSELYRALLEIGLVEERRSRQRPADEENPSERAEDILQARPAPTVTTAAATEEPVRADKSNGFDDPLRHLLEEQRVEIRKDMLLSMETVARQTSAKLQKELQEQLITLQPPPAKSPGLPQLPLLLLSVALLLSLIWNYTLTQTRHQQNRVAQLPAPIENTSADTANTDQAQLETLQAEMAERLRDSWLTAAWAANQDLTFRYDEIALDGDRAEIIETLLSRLNAAGYQGTVTVQTHVGEFCLLGDQEKGFRLPPPDLTLEKCDFIGNPVQATDTPATHQSLEFANFLTTTPLLTDSDITLDIVSLPRTQALSSYPPKNETTASSWNQAAAANNRIIIQLQP